MRTIYCTAFAVCLTGNLIFDQAAADSPSKSIQVSVDDLGKGAVLIGRLKKPLGTMMSIQGKWHYPSINVKDYSLRFTVTQVDGMPIDRPVEFNIDQLSVVNKDGQTAIPEDKRRKDLDGIEWKLRAYESGRFDEVPLEYWRELKVAPPAFPYWFDVFTSQVNGVLQP